MSIGISMFTIPLTSSFIYCLGPKAIISSISICDTKYYAPKINHFTKLLILTNSIILTLSRRDISRPTCNLMNVALGTINDPTQGLL